MTATQQPSSHHENLAQGVLTALKDKSLLIFLAANTFYATYVALVTSTIPLYFTNVVAGADSIPGVSMGSTANLFTWCYIGVGAVLQLPIAQLFTAFQRVRVLMVAMLLWATGFFLLWATGTFATSQFLWGILALCILSIASVTYKPFFVAIVSDLAPESLRGAYTAVSSQSWTIGYFIGPIMGGWAIDQAPVVSRFFWLVVAASTLVCITLLRIFETMHPAAEVQLSE
jgi:MFS family permease